MTRRQEMVSVTWLAQTIRVPKAFMLGVIVAFSADVAPLAAIWLHSVAVLLMGVGLGLQLASRVRPRATPPTR